MASLAGQAPVRRRWSTPPALDVALAAVLTVAAVLGSVHQAGAPQPWAGLAAAVTAAAVALRTCAPLAMCAAAAAGLASFALVPGSGTPLWAFVTMLLLAFSAGAHLAGRRLVVGMGWLLLAGYLLQALAASRHPADGAADAWISPLIIIGAPAIAGWLLRRARAQAAELRRLKEQLEDERAAHVEAAAAAERHRIARELHDVIAHSVSVMVVQAGAAEQLMPAGAEARTRVHAVRETGKEALAELRRQLGLLREGEASSRVPLPGLEEIPALVERAGAELLVHGDCLSPLLPGLALTVYRLVQEALTNARRHGAGAAVSVSLTHQQTGIDIEVVDRGSTRPGPVVPGNGLRGMEERVRMYGGRLHVGPGESGGWRVHAWLPTRDDAVL